jgi:hypothetical protein
MRLSDAQASDAQDAKEPKNDDCFPLPIFAVYANPSFYDFPSLTDGLNFHKPRLHDNLLVILVPSLFQAARLS